MDKLNDEELIDYINNNDLDDNKIRTLFSRSVNVVEALSLKYDLTKFDDDLTIEADLNKVKFLLNQGLRKFNIDDNFTNMMKCYIYMFYVDKFAFTKILFNLILPDNSVTLNEIKEVEEFINEFNFNDSELKILYSSIAILTYNIDIIKYFIENERDLSFEFHRKGYDAKENIMVYGDDEEIILYLFNKGYRFCDREFIETSSPRVKLVFNKHMNISLYSKEFTIFCIEFESLKEFEWFIEECSKIEGENIQDPNTKINMYENISSSLFSLIVYDLTLQLDDITEIKGYINVLLKYGIKPIEGCNLLETEMNKEFNNKGKRDYLLDYIKTIEKMKDEKEYHMFNEPSDVEFTSQKLTVRRCRKLIKRGYKISSLIDENHPLIVNINNVKLASLIIHNLKYIKCDKKYINWIDNKKLKRKLKRVNRY